MTHPIRLVVPDLFQDRLPKLTEHAAHVDTVMAQSRNTTSGSLSGVRCLPRVYDALSCIYRD